MCLTFVLLFNSLIHPCAHTRNPAHPPMQISPLEPTGLRHLLHALSIADFPINHVACAQQRDGFNCGVFAVAFAMYVASGKPVPLDFDGAALRRIMVDMLVKM